MIDVDELTLHWLAGLLEGEGSFCVGTPSNPSKPVVAVQMADEDVIAKVASIFGVKYHISDPERTRQNGWRDVYRTKVTGKNAVELMQMLRPLMGMRRQAQIDRAMSCYKGDCRRILSPEQMKEIRQRSQNGENMLKLAKEFGISKSLAYYIRQGYTYKRA